MRTVAFRELLREPKKIFPIPVEGIEVVRREGNFYIYPKANEPIVRQTEPKESKNVRQTVKVEKMSDIYPEMSDKPLVEEKIVEKIRKVAETIKKTEKIPMFCPKHNAMRIGMRYNCGCPI